MGSVIRPVPADTPFRLSHCALGFVKNDLVVDGVDVD